MPKYIPTGWAKWVVTWCGTTRSRQRTRWRRSPCSQHRGTRRRTAAPLPWKYPKCSEHSAHIRWRSMKWAGTVLRSSTWYVLEFLRRFRYCYGILFKFSFFSFSPCPFFSIFFSNKIAIQTSIYLENSASIQPRTSLSKFAKNYPKVRKTLEKHR